MTKNWTNPASIKKKKKISLLFKKIKYRNSWIKIWVVLISEYTLVSTFHWREEPERKKERNIYGILTVATILWGRHYHLHWLMRELIRGFPRSCISRSHLHGEQYKFRNGFSILWLKSPFNLAAPPALVPRENVRGRTLCGREELRAWNIFHTQRNSGEKKGQIHSFTSVSGMKKSIFNYMGKVDRGLTYQKCWVQGWRLNMERGSIYYYLRE